MKFSILFGGVSWEHEISIVSAISLKKVLEDKIEHFIFADASHRFYLIPAHNMKSNFFSSQEYKKCAQIEMKLGGFYIHSLFGSKPVPTEVLINLIHGADGEDGTIASLLEFYKIPFIGPRIEACVLSFNKYLTKLYAKERDVKTLPFKVLRKHTPRDIGNDFPMIIKPNRLGSSIGVSVIDSPDEIDYAIDSAFEFDKEALIEPFIKGVKEYNLAGCKIAEGNNADNEYVFSIIEEPSKKDLLDFENKYLDFARTEQVLKADIPKDLEERIKEAFKKIYCDKFEGALIRCDFFVIENEIYLNEINPIPGSMANYLFDDFVNTLENLGMHLPTKEPIKISYKYIEKIQRVKGK
ncbi:D-alanine--D-alanine ligase A [Helicobacter sp. 12S02232-10]|uniref:D-alanine--D-alanine ligase n=1 Tax=Helicobacter sp. 12S02232-10 TaxID=1476197 RepID=UPI000BA58E1A|nr:D-alanine--D-alanine ligase [Helicobacter sp. 12S02232-10]PAF47680.1 D-alanine--D-alanine ligase A [Helicobacter sp. 12S02232-10]